MTHPIHHQFSSTLIIQHQETIRTIHFMDQRNVDVHTVQLVPILLNHLLTIEDSLASVINDRQIGNIFSQLIPELSIVLHIHIDCILQLLHIVSMDYFIVTLVILFVFDLLFIHQFIFYQVGELDHYELLIKLKIINLQVHQFLESLLFLMEFI